MPVNYSVVFALVCVALMLVLMWRLGRRKSGGRRSYRPGAITAGAIYDLLNEDRRKAIEVIVESRAAARDPEDRDGNLPDLEEPQRTRSRG